MQPHPSASTNDVSTAIHVRQNHPILFLLGVVLEFFADLEIANHSFLWSLSH